MPFSHNQSFRESSTYKKHQLKSIAKISSKVISRKRRQLPMPMSPSQFSASFPSSATSLYPPKLFACVNSKNSDKNLNRFLYQKYPHVHHSKFFSRKRNGYSLLSPSSSSPFFLLRPIKSFSFCQLSVTSPFLRGYKTESFFQQESMIRLRASSIDEWEREKASDERDYFKIESKTKTMNFGIHDQVQVQLDHHPSELMKYMAKNPERIIYAAWEEDLIEKSKPNDKNWQEKNNKMKNEAIDIKGYYRILTPKVKFIRWEFQPCLDMVVYTDDQNHLVLQSQSWEVGNKQTITGVDQDLIKAFDIEIKCKLYVDGYGAEKMSTESTDLRGDMLFFMSGKLPLVLRLTPNIIIRKAATLVNNTIMSYAKRRFMDNIVADFEGWKREQVR